MRTETHGKPRLFCFPYAGGASTIYNVWPPRLAPSIDVHPVELPGRGRRIDEPLIPDLDALVEKLADELQHAFVGRYAFYGHSVGALVAFELARVLRARGAPLPSDLFLAAKAGPLVWDETLARRHLLPDHDFKIMLQKMGGMPEGLLEMDEVMAVFLPILRADFALWGTYRHRPEPPLPCTLHLFGGTQDSVDREDLLAWQAQFESYAGCRWYDAGHFFVHSHAAQIQDAIRSALDPVDA